MGNIVLDIQHLDKMYPGVHALADFSMTLEEGEIHCLLGQNGAGKSTLVKMLSGIVIPDSGEMFLDGEKLELKNPVDAQHQGIFTIHQELSLIPELSVAENIYIDSLPKNKFGFIDWKEMEKKSKEILLWLGFDMDVTIPVKRLSMAQKASIELAKALHHDARVILLDEPTAALPAVEVKKFFSIVKNLASKGIAFIFISHRLDEAIELCKKATVLRDGKKVGTFDIEGKDEKYLVKAMIGQDLSSSIINKVLEGNAVQLGTGGTEEVVLSARNLSNGKFVNDINFDLHKQEILGITGLVGSGQNDLALMLFDGKSLVKGDVSIFGKPVKIKHPKDAIKQSLGLLPEERKTQGLVLGMSILHNSSLASLNLLSKGSIMNHTEEKTNVENISKKVRLARSGNLNNAVKSLSGGNQQKVVLSKWLMSKCKILIFAEPTRGIDMGAKEEIYGLIRAFVDEGGSVIMITSEISEAIMCDRVLVMSHGTLNGEIRNEDIENEDSILNLY